MDNIKVIKADTGFILHNGAGTYAHEVTVPDGVVWEQVEDIGQLNTDTEDDVNQIQE